MARRRRRITHHRKFRFNRRDKNIKGGYKIQPPNAKISEGSSWEVVSLRYEKDINNEE